MSKNIIIEAIVSLLVGGSIGYQAAPKGKVLEHTMTDNGILQNSIDNMVSDLKNKKGNTLDSTFLNQLIISNEGEIEIAKTVLASSKRPEIKKMAEDIINTRSSEIITMKSWLNKWFGI